MREFKVEVRGDIILQLDKAVIAAVDDDWRHSLYDLKTTEEIIEHLAYNLFVNNRMLSSLDGWADQPHTNAKVIVHDPRLDLGWEFEVEELVPKGQE